MSAADIDCRGLKCPEPVIKTRQALAAAKGSFTVLVDNETARDNVTRFARTSGCEVDVSDVEGGFLLTVEPKGEPVGVEAASTPCASSIGTVIFISSDEIGTGDRELGVALMKSFLYASAESDALPAKMVFMNSGVRLVTQNEETVNRIKKLEERGVEVLACGTCLDYYGLKDELMVGRVSNIYEIQSALISADKLVSI